MKQLCVALATIATLGASQYAHAGGYIAVGIGADASLSGDMAGHFTTDMDDGSSGRLAIGQRFGRLAVEAAIYGADIQSTTGLGGGASYSTVTLGVAGKYYIPVAGRLEAYGKVGLDKTYLVAGDDARASGYSGRGHNLGAGLEFGFQAGILGRAAIWLDYTHQSFELRNDGMRDLDGGAQLLTLGVSLGF